MDSHKIPPFETNSPECGARRKQKIYSLDRILKIGTHQEADLSTIGPRSDFLSYTRGVTSRDFRIPVVYVESASSTTLSGSYYLLLGKLLCELEKSRSAFLVLGLRCLDGEPVLFILF